MSPADAIRDLLLAQHLLAAVPPAPRALQQRVYRAAVAVVPPSMAAMRAVGATRPESDEALVAAFGGGDAGAFETLVQRHLAWMVAWARQHLPQADAEDAAQEAFLALVHKATALQLQSTLRGYLFGLLRIQVLLARRAHGEVAEAMLRVCTLREQEVLLFDLEDADDKVIAAALDMTEGHVRVVRHRAITK
ncbi:MAG: sigma factor, partial [Gemmatimonadaceae bacterium]